MERWLSFVAIVVLGLALVIGAACGGEGEEEGVTELKYGIGLPLTGIYGAAVGLPCKYAYEMGADKIGVFEVAGKKYRWNIIFEENLFSIQGGTASANKFIYEHHVQFMDQVGADSGLAAQPICEEAGMMLGLSACNFDDFGPDKPYLFQTSATWSLHTPVFFDWLRKEHSEVHRVAYVGLDDRTGYAVGEAVTASADYYGLEIVVEEYIPVETLEMMPVANRIMDREPDLYVGPIGGGLDDIYAMMVAMGYDGLAASYYWTEDGADRIGDRIGWEKLEGYLLFLPFPVGDVWPEVTTFREEYDDRYGIEFTPSAFWAANMPYVMTSVLQQAGTVDDMDKIIETMETKSFETLSGPIRYGLKELNGIGHLAIYPTPIMKVVGEREYELLAYYSPEETEAIAVEVFK